MAHRVRGGRAPLIGPLTQVKTYTDILMLLAVQEAGAVVLDQAEALTAPICEEIARRRDATRGAPRGRLPGEAAEAATTSGWRSPTAWPRRRSRGTHFRSRGC